MYIIFIFVIFFKSSGVIYSSRGSFVGCFNLKCITPATTSTMTFYNARVFSSCALISSLDEFITLSIVASYPYTSFCFVNHSILSFRFDKDCTCFLKLCSYYPYLICHQSHQLIAVFVDSLYASAYVLLCFLIHSLEEISTSYTNE